MARRSITYTFCIDRASSAATREIRTTARKASVFEFRDEYFGVLWGICAPSVRDGTDARWGGTQVTGGGRNDAADAGRRLTGTQSYIALGGIIR